MTRKSKREIASKLDALAGAEDSSVQEYLWADLKSYYGGRLSQREAALVENPGDYLSPAGKRALGHKDNATEE